MAGRLSLSGVRKGAASLSDAASLAPKLPPIGILPGALGVVQGPGTITFTLNGQPRWQIDIRQFAGTPSLTIKPDARGTLVTLQGARFPGTQLPADFVLLAARTLEAATGMPSRSANSKYEAS
jgi:hypothetical protein